MSNSSPGKGSKKAVQQFSTRDGLWMLVVVCIGMIILLALWLLGIFHLDAD